ncbi:MAG: tripartite tricarboxylate transporter substrate binding protein [Burkholderiales bacterium]|nr:tripartite tricarboxylate transporter substrate binding protein [Burkholderiales bacterium]
MAGIVLAACALLVAAAESYPSRPIRIVDAFPPGGPSDIVARTINQKLSEALGQPVVVDNRGGAAGVLGCDLVAKSAPDGYTLLIGPSGALTIQPTLNAKLPFDPQRDFVTITQLTSGPQVIAVHPSVPAKTVRELIELARARPGQLNYASGGGGTANHIAVEAMKLAAGIDIVHVPYKGTGPALAGVLTGEAQMIIASLLATLPHAKSGRLRALAVTTSKRSAALPDVSTAAESGLPKFETSSWHGMLAPAKTPRAIVTKLHAEFVRVMLRPDVKERLNAQGLDVVASTPDEFAAHIRAETIKYARVIREIGLKAE